MRLSKEKEYLVEDNVRLVDYLVLKLGVVPNSEQHKDLRSIGFIALTKAAITYDEQKGCTFATYASRVINNELFMNYRREKKRANDISLDAPIWDNGKGDEIALGEMVEDSRINFVEDITNEDDISKVLSIILNLLKPRQKIIILYQMADLTQAEIAEKLSISQSYISRLQAKSISRVRRAYQESIDYKEVFRVSMSGEMYKITFASKDVREFNQIFATLLRNLTSAENLPDFKVSCNKERIVIQVPAHQESFAFIAEIMQKIDDFSMTFVSDKSKLTEGEDVSQEVKANESDEGQAVASKPKDEVNAARDQIELPEGTEDEFETQEQIINDNLSSSTEEDKTALTSDDSKAKRGSQIKEVREYMLSLDGFTIEVLRRKFPKVPYTTINNAISLAKNKGLIKSTGERGKYRVIKT